MSRLTKGAIATAAGVTLLLGGAGTFALWNDSIAVDSRYSITAGHLRFAEGTVDGAWFDVSAGPSEEELSLKDFRMVPGDVVEFRGTVDIEAEGDNLWGSLGVDPASIDLGDSPIAITLTSGFEDGPIADGDELGFTLRIEWPFGNPDNSSQGESIDLRNVQFTLTQVRPAA